MTKNKKQPELPQEDNVDELKADLQRTRADFENYRKRIDAEKDQIRDHATSNAILKLLPVVDNIDRALGHLPDELRDNAWAQSVVNLSKHLDKSLESLQLARIDASKGAPFNPDLHEAIQMDDGDGDTEVISEELQPGYTLRGKVIRPSMVKVTKTSQS